LHAWATERLTRFKVPRYWQELDALPRTPTQRIAKHMLPGGHPGDEFDAEMGTGRCGRRRGSCACSKPYWWHPVHKAGDPRTPVIYRIAEESGALGPHLQLFAAIGRVHAAILGRTLPLNGAGVCGAALADLDFPVGTLRGFALLARTAGILGHLAEEQRRPIGPAIYDDVDRSTDYRS
jgi:Citrate synthase, C-terminal domain